MHRRLPSYLSGERSARPASASSPEPNRPLQDRSVAANIFGDNCKSPIHLQFSPSVRRTPKSLRGAGGSAAKSQANAASTPTFSKFGTPLSILGAAALAAAAVDDEKENQQTGGSSSSSRSNDCVLSLAILADEPTAAMAAHGAAGAGAVLGTPLPDFTGGLTGVAASTPLPAAPRTPRDTLLEHDRFGINDPAAYAAISAAGEDADAGAAAGVTRASAAAVAAAAAAGMETGEAALTDAERGEADSFGFLLCTGRENVSFERFARRRENGVLCREAQLVAAQRRWDDLYVRLGLVEASAPPLAPMSPWMAGPRYTPRSVAKADAEAEDGDVAGTASVRQQLCFDDTAPAPAAAPASVPAAAPAAAAIVLFADSPGLGPLVPPASLTLGPLALAGGDDDVDEDVDEAPLEDVPDSTDPTATSAKAGGVEDDVDGDADDDEDGGMGLGSLFSSVNVRLPASLAVDAAVASSSDSSSSSSSAAIVPAVAAGAASPAAGGRSPRIGPAPEPPTLFVRRAVSAEDAAVAAATSLTSRVARGRSGSYALIDAAAAAAASASEAASQAPPSSSAITGGPACGAATPSRAAAAAAAAAASAASSHSAPPIASLPHPAAEPELLRLVERLGLDPRLRADAWMLWSGASELKRRAQGRFAADVARAAVDVAYLYQQESGEGASAAESAAATATATAQVLDSVDTPLHLLTYAQLQRRPVFARRFEELIDVDGCIVVDPAAAAAAAASQPGQGTPFSSAASCSSPSSSFARIMSPHAIAAGAALPRKLSAFLSSPACYAQTRSTLEQIDRDIARTTCQHPYFSTPQAHKILARVLTAYAHRNPSLGYLQSMNFLVALLLVVFTPSREEDVFWTLAALVEDNLPDHYTPRLRGLRVLMTVFSELVRSEIPWVAEQLSKTASDVSFRSVSWFLCLFFTYLPPEAVVVCWDVFFAHVAAARAEDLTAGEMKAEPQQQRPKQKTGGSAGGTEGATAAQAAASLCASPHIGAYSSPSTHDLNTPAPSSSAAAAAADSGSSNGTGGEEPDLSEGITLPYARACAVLCCFGLGLLQELSIRLDKAGASTLQASEVLQTAGSYVVDAQRLASFAFTSHSVQHIGERVRVLRAAHVAAERESRAEVDRRRKERQNARTGASAAAAAAAPATPGGRHVRRPSRTSSALASPRAGGAATPGGGTATPAKPSALSSFLSPISSLISSLKKKAKPIKVKTPSPVKAPALASPVKPSAAAIAAAASAAAAALPVPRGSPLSPRGSQQQQHGRSPARKYTFVVAPIAPADDDCCPVGVAGPASPNALARPVSAGVKGSAGAMGTPSARGGRPGPHRRQPSTAHMTEMGVYCPVPGPSPSPVRPVGTTAAAAAAGGPAASPPRAALASPRAGGASLFPSPSQPQQRGTFASPLRPLSASSGNPSCPAGRMAAPSPRAAAGTPGHARGHSRSGSRSWASPARVAAIPEGGVPNLPPKSSSSSAAAAAAAAAVASPAAAPAAPSGTAGTPGHARKLSLRQPPSALYSPRSARVVFFSASSSGMVKRPAPNAPTPVDPAATGAGSPPSAKAAAAPGRSHAPRASAFASPARAASAGKPSSLSSPSPARLVLASPGKAVASGAGAVASPSLLRVTLDPAGGKRKVNDADLIVVSLLDAATDGTAPLAEEREEEEEGEEEKGAGIVPAMAAPPASSDSSPCQRSVVVSPGRGAKLGGASSSLCVSVFADDDDDDDGAEEDA